GGATALRRTSRLPDRGCKRLRAGVVGKGSRSVGGRASSLCVGGRVVARRGVVRGGLGSFSRGGGGGAVGRVCEGLGSLSLGGVWGGGGWGGGGGGGGWVEAGEPGEVWVRTGWRKVVGRGGVRAVGGPNFGRGGNV